MAGLGADCLRWMCLVMYLLLLGGLRERIHGSTTLGSWRGHGNGGVTSSESECVGCLGTLAYLAMRAA